jgi:UDP-N-acetylmuramoyl-L-alanyl-D-glutamate--2,6-diaminopimelate ligase
MLRSFKQSILSITPPGVRNAYHFVLAFIAALVYGFPSRRLIVIGVTGTKGKSSTIEYANALFEAAGHTTAIASTVRIKISSHAKPNLTRMTMLGRFFQQRFLDRAARAGCTVAFLEMTSEGARQHRHRFIELDALIFTNLTPEHIESHGSLEAYADAKFELGKQLLRSHKRPRVLVANADDAVGARFLTLPVDHALPFSLAEAGAWKTDENGSEFEFDGTRMSLRLPGAFSVQNALAAATLAHAFGIDTPTIARGLASLTNIPGRAERIEEGQDFLVVVDYAHTPDSLKAIYDAYKGRRRVCVLGSTGGGRDMWKRPVMGAIADEACEYIILTNEDPYDEEPRSIAESIASGMKHKTPEIIMDRREAIRRAFALARSGDAVLITGKGTDPNICGPRGTKTPWSDSAVAREELRARASA